MICPECRTRTRCKVNVHMDIPAEFFKRLTKQAIRLQTVWVEGVNWEKSRIYCPHCGWERPKDKGE